MMGRVARNALWASGVCFVLGCSDDEDSARDGGSEDAATEPDAGGDEADAGNKDPEGGSWGRLPFHCQSEARLGKGFASGPQHRLINCLPWAFGQTSI